MDILTPEALLPVFAKFIASPNSLYYIEALNLLRQLNYHSVLVVKSIVVKYLFTKVTTEDFSGLRKKVLNLLKTSDHYNSEIKLFEVFSRIIQKFTKLMLKLIVI